MTGRGWLVTAVAGLLALAGCTGSPAERASAFSAGRCPGEVTAVVVGELTCGYLTVPENRSHPGRKIRVFVTRVTPTRRLHDDPMLVVGTDLGALPNYGGVAPLAQRVGRDVIIMDTRGVGHSEPSLDCPQVEQLRADVLAAATNEPAIRSRFLDAVAACHDRLSAQGVDVSAYNLSEMAADTEDLRAALGVEKWNVVTYGTASRIALQMLRTSAGAMRSLLLDSPEVPGTDPRAIAATATRAQLDAVLASCVADRACSAAFPHAKTSLDTALARLAAHPVTLELDDAASSGTVRVRYDDAMLVRTLRAMLSDGGSSGPLTLRQSVPAFLERVNAGRLMDLAPSLAPIITGAQTYCIGYQPKCLPQHRTSAGVLYSVLCHDIAPFHDGAVAAGTARPGPGIGPAYGAGPLLDVCSRWPTGDKAAASVDQPPSGDVPTLVALGRFDPYAPEATVRDGLRGLPKAVFAVDPGNGHNVMVSTDCLAAARTTWLDTLALPAAALDCMGDQVSPFVTDPASLVEASSPSVAATTDASPAGPGQLQGTWLVSLSRDTIAEALARGGFPDLSERFFRQEETPADGIRFLLRIRDGTFSGVYNDGLDEQGEWYVGWSGTVTVRGDQLELTAPDDGTTDTLRYRVNGDRLTLTPIRSTPATFRGLPTQAYDHAYLAAQPLVRVDCADVAPPCT